MSILSKIKTSLKGYRAAGRFRLYYAGCGINALAIAAQARRRALEQRALDCDFAPRRLLYAVQLGPETWACLWADGELTDHVDAPLSGEERETLERILWWGEVPATGDIRAVDAWDGDYEMRWRWPSSEGEYLYTMQARLPHGAYEWTDLKTHASIEEALAHIGVTP